MFYNIHMHDKQKSSSKKLVVVHAERTCALIKKILYCEIPRHLVSNGVF